MLARPSRAWLIAGVAMLASVLGGMMGYWIGATLFDSVGRPVLEFYGKTDYFADFSVRYNQWGAWAVLMAGITPFPYKVITIMSGWTAMPLGVFIATSILARGVRFFLVAVLLWKFGEPIRDFIERRLGLMFTIAVALLIGGFVAVRYL